MRVHRSRVVGTVAAAALALGLGPAVASATTAVARTHAAHAAIDPGLTTSHGSAVRIIVSGRPGALADVVRDVRAAGGTIRRSLPIIDGVAATVRPDRLVWLAHRGDVSAITADRSVQLTGSSWDASTSASPYVWNAGAASVWQSSGTRGAGVSIAVLDTGVSAVDDLAGRVMAGPDLSGENNNAVDSYGHGTVMAGIIAGDGTDSQPSPRTGIAPAAEIISVKVAGANGATDVSTVLAGLSWVGAFHSTYNIRVLNLSWGVPSTQDPRVDPLNYAVERLWTMGVTVVTAAGNNGPGAGTILKPGDDPVVITAGAYDDKGDQNLANDSVPAWSSQGPTAQGVGKPDLVAPGRTIIATRSPGSTVETNNPKALVAPSYIKASGTSEAAAVVSGVTALLVSAHPGWTPDQIKYALLSTASPITGTSAAAQGAGRVQAAAAVAANVAAAPTSSPVSNGTGSLAASRGGGALVSVTCNGTAKVLNDETTSWCAPWDSSAWTSTAWTSSAWTSSAWTSTAWTSSAWTSSAWTSSAWTSATYDDTPFLTAFWGSHPHWWQHLPGERSDPGPAWARSLD